VRSAGGPERSSSPFRHHRSRSARGHRRSVANDWFRVAYRRMSQTAFCPDCYRLPCLRALARQVLAAAVMCFVTPDIVRAQATAPLIWVTGEPTSEGDNKRMALAVTAQVAGRPCRMQLDTGFNDAVRWQMPAADRDQLVSVKVEFAGISLSVGTSAAVARQLTRCEPGDSVGTLGNAFFDGGTLRLDLKTPQLGYTPGSSLAEHPEAQPMFYARWTRQGGHPLVELREDGKLTGYALLDTGSAPVGFAPLSKSAWDRVTSSMPLAATKDVSPFLVSSWGRPHTCYKASSAVRLQAGRWTLMDSPVSYCPDLGFATPVKVEGVIGLAAFADAVVTIDYPSGRWLAERAP